MTKNTSATWQDARQRRRQMRTRLPLRQDPLLDTDTEPNHAIQALMRHSYTRPVPPAPALHVMARRRAERSTP